jgi:ParB/RepB/Spo0J family partition protein
MHHLKRRHATMDTPNPPQSGPIPNQAPTVLVELDRLDIPQDARVHKPEKLESLAQDLKDQGQIQAIIVCPHGDRFEVVVGAGRVQAARKLGWTQIKGEVREGLTDFDKARLTFSENEEREDADSFHQADQLQKMMKAKGWSQGELAAHLGQGLSNVKIYLALLGADPAFREVASRLATPITHLNQIQRLNDPKEQIQLTQQTHDKDLSVRQLKALVDQKLGKVEKKGVKGTQRSGESPVEPDPLGDFFPNLMMNPQIAPMGSWRAYRGPVKLLSPKGPTAMGWHFEVAIPGITPKADFKRFFQKLSEAIDTGQEEADQQKFWEEAVKADPTLPEQMRKMEADVEAKNKAAAEEARKRLEADQALDAMVSAPTPPPATPAPLHTAPPSATPQAAQEEEPLDPKIAAMVKELREKGGLW